MMQTYTQAQFIAGIDPGLASGGFVVLDRAEDSVAAAFSLVEPAGEAKKAKEKAFEIAQGLGGWSDVEFLSACIRAEIWMEKFRESFEKFEKDHGQISVFALESFVDQKQHAKKMMRNRWQVPFLTGLLLADLQKRGYSSQSGTIIYQNAGTVLTQLREELERLKNRTGTRDIIMQGDRQITNSHQRSAFAHALALSLRLPAYTNTKQPTHR